MVDIGDDAPDFELHDGERNLVSGGGHKGQKVVLAFFPAAFTGVCKKELCIFQDSLAALNDANATVLGISVDSPFSNNAFAAANDITFPILSDHTRSTVRAYGVELDDFAGMEGYTAAQRSVFIVDENGDVAWKWVADVPSEEPDYAEIVAFLTA
ncbi:MAG: redoxin domain-containing protein [Candidatus Poseidoniaceae archaeon]|nr:redoxin domain-containing protein [Candidatus Poseidoniaceae archaeon]